jgi:hypothetical protein
MLEMPKQRGFKQERILRIILNHANGEMSKYRIAKEGDMSEEWVLDYTARLEAAGMLDGTAIEKPRDLYEEWLDIRVQPNQLAVSFQRPMEVLEEINLNYVLTTYRAENLVQGFLFPSTTDFYIRPEQRQGWLDLVEDRGLLGGGNTRIRITDEHVFYNNRSLQGQPTVSTPQLIVDLLDEGGPCEEAAEKLIETFHGAE